MKIAFLGTRGIPAQYGGFETCAEEVAKGLVKEGHEVWVYCRSGYYKKRPTEYQGVKLVYIPEPRSKSFETLWHTFKSILHSVWRRFDILFVFNSGNTPFLLIPLLLRKKIVLHMDGLEWKREKWGTLGRNYHKFAEKLAAKLPVEIISDSMELKKYYRQQYKKTSHYIPYGAPLKNSQDPSILRQFYLKPQEYFLQITRFEPENNPLLTVRAFERVETDKKLVLVGGAKYPTPYSQQIYITKDNRVEFLGFVYDKDIIRELYCNCYSYIHGNEVGGTNPALLEAMASGCFVICRNVPFNREVLEGCGIYFEKNPADLAKKISWCLENPDQIHRVKPKSREIITERYTWESVVKKYETLFKSMLKSES